MPASRVRCGVYSGGRVMIVFRVMPYKIESIKLPPELDRRVKLTDTQRLEIQGLRQKGLSYRVIAERYGVSKSLVISECNPDIKERKRQAFIRRSREGRYKTSSEERAVVMREHRRYKHELFKQGKL